LLLPLFLVLLMFGHFRCFAAVAAAAFFVLKKKINKNNKLKFSYIYFRKWLHVNRWHTTLLARRTKQSFVFRVLIKYYSICVKIVFFDLCSVDIFVWTIESKSRRYFVLLYFCCRCINRKQLQNIIKNRFIYLMAEQKPILVLYPFLIICSWEGAFN